jgi:chromosomal replication initiator protein
VSRVRCILRDMGVSFATFRGDLLMPQRALELAAREANSTVSELVSPERLRHLYTVRYAYMAAMSRHGLSTPRIGRRLKRDHTTILHGLKRANELAERSPQFAALVERLAAA